ncbi:unnamed protein product [Somion occarium]|uniref:Chitobiosyldiphosphodolichol beta-mannosyltransferase n=1 Tax=Somion occarium TaxID=3059160 RepID=A0ABP1CNT9_9APHY
MQSDLNFLRQDMEINIILQLLAILTFCFFVWQLVKQPLERPSLRSVAILVLGDIGRSPRMMYHAESFAENNFETYLIGNDGSKPVPSLLSIPHVHFLYLPNAPSTSGLPFILSAPRKIVHQVFSILNALLFRIPRPPEFIVVQNPPSIPTLALVWLVGELRGSKVIIDWHNLGYSILALKLGDTHPFVKLAKWFEAYFGRCAYAHLFVTNAMRDFLVREWHLQGHKVVLHDRPPAYFHRTSPSEMHELFLHLQPSFSAPSLQNFLPAANPPFSTPFTQTSSPHHSKHTPPSTLELEGEYDFSPMPHQRLDRPALLISSTSWTPDEDFSILLEALKLYEQKARDASTTGGGLPKVLMVVTGKGPERDKYMSEVAVLQKEWQWVRCVSMWLEPEDYPLLLGSADLGISLHSSSSALDLPMKVVDMFGCGLPVCALDFACLHELVQDGVNGLVFHNAQELATQLASLLASFPTSPTLASLRQSLEASGKGAGNWEWGSWSENWNRVMRPLVLRDVPLENT